MAYSNSAVIFVTATLVHLFMKTAAVRARPAILTLLVPTFISGIDVATIIPIGVEMRSINSLVVINVWAAASAALAIADVWLSSGMVTTDAMSERHVELPVAA